MSVKSFKFVSPGVFINEIDNSFVPRSADAIGPVVIGRSQRGPAMQPVKVSSYSEFVTMFGDTVPGGAGGDISRDGNFQSPMYGTYAAKAFLVSNVAPLTYIRVLGNELNSGDNTAGWKTTDQPNVTDTSNGGAYGLFLFASSSVLDASTGAATPRLGTGSLAAVWYLNDAVSIGLKGDTHPQIAAGTHTTCSLGSVIVSDSNNNFTTLISDRTTGIEEEITFGFNDNLETFVRKRFNTNPQLVSSQGSFYDSGSYKAYWLGESYEQEVRDLSLDGATAGSAFGVILPIADSSAPTTVGPALKQVPSREAYTGWFIGQDLGGDASTFDIQTAAKLFRLVGRGHGGWLNRNVKVSIEQIRASASTTTDYGTFSVVLRSLSDTDGNQQVLERFDNLTLDPTSPNFIGRRIGDTYQSWVESERRLKTYGDYPNNSKYVYVELQSDVEDGGANPLLLPFGYWGPPKYKTVNAVTLSSLSAGAVYWANGTALASSSNAPLTLGLSHGTDAGPASGALGGLSFPEVRLRLSSSDGGMADQRNACFGYQNTRTSGSSRADASVGDFNKMLDGNIAEGATYSMAGSGMYISSYIFSMNDLKVGANNAYFWKSGSYVAGTAASIADGGTYKTVLAAGYDRFTAPLYGGFDGFDIKVPDPLYNAGMTSTATEANSSPYYTLKRAIDTVADPESVNMNLITMPGITNDSLNNHMVNVSEGRGDTMSIIDLPNLYYPQHEVYKSSKADRLGVGVNASVTALRNRRIDSSYGATFYPWVQTRDANSGRAIWVPPSVAMMGVLASSQAASHLWYAPAGFNRGGLSDGAAGIPVTNVTERLTSKERDTLYDANINPIASFPSSGIVVFGQKTLQERQSALDRINVRRLVIYLKKQISILSTEVLFEQNVQSTWNRFKSLVEPFLANVKVQFGITDYRLILDETTTTPDLIDQNIMYAKIMVKPARAIEYIAIDFVIANTGASFDD